MNVIGIIQTDLNEFSVLFDQDQGGGQNGQGGQGSNAGQSQNQSHSQGGQDSGDSDSMFLSFLDEQPSSNEGNSNSAQGGQGGQGGQQNGPQEMTVRIKGIPEGQKANFLQMYQIIQDAKDSQTLEQSLTIVGHGDQQDSPGGRDAKQNQGQGHGSGNQN
ncbi:hypothetical protein [uncultured Brevibacillus sp.]|uniref:hypothetical protein n=1 Tax=uncultured Brevibacillus sp. TaxID=169970 RepID=UPI0025946140|nr:hypothetical protein [uncultured Brevibacillus sp.]